MNYLIPLLNMQDLAGAVKYLRQSRDVSQVELAEDLGVSQRFISELEQGKPKRLDDDLIFLLRRIGIELQCSVTVKDNDEHS
ncbi:MAG: helix-turn-helix domain-containing protein [Micrococcaceae bacterium]